MGLVLVILVSSPWGLICQPLGMASQPTQGHSSSSKPCPLPSSLQTAANWKWSIKMPEIYGDISFTSPHPFRDERDVFHFPGIWHSRCLCLPGQVSMFEDDHTSDLKPVPSLVQMQLMKFLSLGIEIWEDIVLVIAADHAPASVYLSASGAIM